MKENDSFVSAIRQCHKRPRLSEQGVRGSSRLRYHSLRYPQRARNLQSHSTYIQYGSHVSKSMSHIFKSVWGRASTAKLSSCYNGGRTLICVCGWIKQKQSTHVLLEGLDFCVSTLQQQHQRHDYNLELTFQNPLLLVLGRWDLSYVFFFGTQWL